MTNKGLFLVYLALGILVVFPLLKLHFDPKYRHFDLFDLIMTRDQKADENKIFKLVVFLVSTIVFLHIEWKDKMTWDIFSGYIALWVASAAYALKKRMEQVNGTTGETKDGKT